MPIELIFILQRLAAMAEQDASLRISSRGTPRIAKLGRPFDTCGYVPMVDLLRYLEANGFATYIVSGGNRDFIRVFMSNIYGIRPSG